jgi:hypothetical protein
MVEEAGGSAVDGTGKVLMFNQPEARHRGVVAANPIWLRFTGLWAKAMAEQP